MHGTVNVLHAAELQMHLEIVTMENLMLRMFYHESRVAGELECLSESLALEKRKQTARKEGRGRKPCRFQNSHKT